MTDRWKELVDTEVYSRLLALKGDATETTAARELLQQQLHSSIKTQGLRHPRSIALLVLRAGVESKAHNKRLALRNYSLARKLCQSCLTDSHWLSIESSVGIAMLYRQQGLLTEARSLFERVLDLVKKLPDTAPEFVENLQRNLGLLLCRQGEFNTAQEYLPPEELPTFSEKSLDVAEQLEAYLLLGKFLLEQEREYEALPYLQVAARRLDPAAIELLKDVAPQNLEALVAVFQVREMYDSALPVLENLQAWAEQTGDNEKSLRYLTWKVRLQADAGLLNNNRQQLERSIQLLEESDSHAGSEGELGILYLDLGELQIEAGEHAQARVTLRKALSVLPDDRHNAEARALALHNLGTVAFAEHQIEEALQYLQQALVIREKLFGMEHEEVGRTVFVLGLVLKKMSQFDQALPYLSRALAIRKQTLAADDRAISYNEQVIRECQASTSPGGKQHEQQKVTEVLEVDAPITDITKEQSVEVFKKARALLKAGDNYEALRLFEIVLKDVENQHGAVHPVLRPVLEQMALAFEQLGFVPQAKALRNRAVQISA